MIGEERVHELWQVKSLGVLEETCIAAEELEPFIQLL